MQEGLIEEVSVRALTITVLAVTLGFVELGLTPATARGESLAEIAARERARRKETTGTTVITDDDLAKAAGRSHTGNLGQPATTQTTEAAEGSGGSGGAAASEEKSESELREERAKAWREQNQKAQENVTRLNDEIAKIESELGDMRVYQYGPNRAARLKRLEQAKAELEIAQQKVDDLEEERRREGF